MIRTSGGGLSLAEIATATLPAGTLTTSQPMTLTQTWNAAGVTFTGLKVNITDTASAATSLLMDLQIGGATQFSVSKTGAVDFNGNLGDLGSNWAIRGSDGVMNLKSTFALRWSNGSAGATPDLIIVRDAANTLAQLNGTAAQAFRAYFSYTDVSNYTRLAFKTATTLHTIETESAGTGEANIDLAFTPKGSGRIRFGTHSALAAEVLSGYITIKDAGGTSRKIGVIA